MNLKLSPPSNIALLFQQPVLIAIQASSYRVGADCGNGKLTLYVDGQQIASTSDAAYTNGQIGLFLWSGERADSADMTFDDFLIKSLE